MNKDEEIKYCLLAFDHTEAIDDNDHGNRQLPISGLYNWANALRGKRSFPRTPEEFEKFNLFHINITSKNLFLLPTFLKNKPSSAKLLLNVDFSVELWNQNFAYPDLFLEQINKADYIFAVEPLMAEILSNSLHRYIPCIPHPLDTEGLKKYRTNDRINQIGVSLHRYDNNFLLPYFAVKDFAPEYQSLLLGSTTSSKQGFLHMYDFILENCKFEEMISKISSLYLMYETYTIHSYGRLSAECAVLGIPCVGTHAVYSIKKCFPDLTTNINDIPKQKSLIKKLINDKEFYSEVAMKAVKLSEYYSYKNCVKLLRELLNNANH